jgi:hypothetical protein
MKPAIDIGRMFRMAVQQEAAERGYRGRLSEEFIEETETFHGFRENSLALNRHQHQNIRIPGKSPQVLLEDMGGVSIREIAEETILERDGSPIGRSRVLELFHPADQTRLLEREIERSMLAGRLREAGAETTAMDFTMFQMLVGQLLINSTLKGFEHEDFILSKAAGIYPTEFVTGEVVPGISTPLVKDTMGPTPGQTGPVKNTLLHKPGETYRQASAAENYIRLPATEEHGLIIGLDKTAVYADRTGMVSKIAGDIGEELAAEKEINGLDMLIGVTNLIAPYTEKYAWDDADISIDPYQAGNTALNNGTGQLAKTYPNRPFPFVNEVDNNALNNWLAFQRSDIFQSKINNPNTGRPITLGKFPTLFAPYTARFNIAQVIKHYSQWKISQVANLAPGTTVETGPNLIQDQLGDIDVQVSKLLRQRMIVSGLYGDTTPVQTASIPGTTANGVMADYVWWHGNLKESLMFNQNWAIKVIQAPANSEAEFSQGIAFRWRSDYRGIWAWHNPRKIARQNFCSQAALLNFLPQQS